MEFKLPPESKIVFSLSLTASQCINNDRISFSNSDNGVPELADFIIALMCSTGSGGVTGNANKSFAARSETAIEARMAEKEAHYKNLGLESAACNALLQAYRAELEEKARVRLNYAREDKNAVRNRLNCSEKLCECFADELIHREADVEVYKEKPGYFIRSLLEEYARLPFSLRERFYFKDVYDCLSDAIKGNWVMEASRQTRVNRRDHKSRGRMIQFRPYSIEVAPETGYNYVLGLSRNAAKAKKDPDTPWKPDGLRLCRIVDLRELQNNDDSTIILPFTGEEQSALMNSRKERNISSFHFENEEFTVRFTADGLKTLAQIATDRPQLKNEQEIKKYSRFLKECLFLESNVEAKNLSANRAKRTSDKKKTWELVFSAPCSQTPNTQAKNYFRRFGKDAVIVNDQSADTDLKKYYQDALEAYTEP